LHSLHRVCLLGEECGLVPMVSDWTEPKKL
jgi:hypothetical protein